MPASIRRMLSYLNPDFLRFAAILGFNRSNVAQPTSSQNTSLSGFLNKLCERVIGSESISEVWKCVQKYVLKGVQGSVKLQSIQSGACMQAEDCCAHQSTRTVKSSAPMNRGSELS